MLRYIPQRIASQPNYTA